MGQILTRGSSHRQPSGAGISTMIQTVTNPRAGQPAQPSDLVDVAAPRDGLLQRSSRIPPIRPSRSSFGTSGHRGSSLDGSFNEAHILATTQAICEYRAAAGHRRAAVPRPRHPRPVRAGVGHARSRCSSPTTSPCSSTPPTASPRRPAVSHAILRANGGAHDRGRPRRRHRRHAVAQPADATAASSTTRRTAARPTPTPPAGSRRGPTSCSPPG